MRLSIHARLLIAATLVLALFLGLAGVALDRAYRSSSQLALQEHLQAQVYALLAAAHEDAEGRPRLPAVLPEPRLNTPESGLYAEVRGLDNDYTWRSASLVGQPLQLAGSVAPGERRFETRSAAVGTLYSLEYGVVWETNAGNQRFSFAVATSLAPYTAQQAEFRSTLWRWLAGVAVILVVGQLLVMRWGLRPLQQVADELLAIEQGRASALAGGYPRELSGLTTNINSLLEHSRAREQRYRHSLDDLAHSIKTPLAVLRNLAESGGLATETTIHALQEQISRMDEIVQYQLQRATLSGRTVLARQVEMEPLLRRIVNSLDKVYVDKVVTHPLQITQGARFRGDEGDLMELAGNLLENAWKYCVERVNVTCRQDADGIFLQVADDGPGIPSALHSRVLERGARADQTLPGQGIGLSVVREIVATYGGQIELGRSELGGTRVSIVIPNR